MDDGLLLSGVRYTDIDYDVFTDAADHVANSRSPYRRHTYRYTPFLAMLLSLPISRHNNSAAAASNSGVLGVILSTKYFGKVLFCVADTICGYIILVLRQRSRRDAPQVQQKQQEQQHQMNKRQILSIAGKKYYMPKIINKLLSSPEFIDAMWWLYNPLPINICTRGSAEALIVLLPVLVTVALANHQNNQSTSIMMISSTRQRAVLAGILHGIGIHCKLYPIIYTVSFMANFSRQEQQQQHSKQPKEQQMEETVGWTNELSYEQSSSGFPWKHPMKIITLALLWIQRLFFTWSSILFLLSSILTMVTTTYSAVYFYGHEALNEGLLYHFGRMDHRHNYSMYWYWIYLLRGRQEVVSSVRAATSTWVGNVPLIPQILSEFCLFEPK
jgi:phosphatidylinositol glycan class M